MREALGAAEEIVGSAVEPGAGRVPAQALCDIAAGLASVERHVPLVPGDDPGSPRSLRLIATSVYDVWLITWPAGSGLGYHDHADAVSAVHMVSGSLVESIVGTRRQRRPGFSAVVMPYTAHRRWNPTTGEATSVHVYTPPLAAVTHHEPGATIGLHPAGSDVAPRTRHLVPRPAEASNP